MSTRPNDEVQPRPSEGHYRRVRRKQPPLELDELAELVHPSTIRHPNRVRVRPPPTTTETER